jgi:lipopolysaccharide transport system ATP-binding protein
MCTAIEVNNISKLYEIGRQRSGSLLETLSGMFQPQVDEDESHFWALKDISFQVTEGEALGIIGRNGAGKSTLLKILSRITYPTEGQVKIYGRVSSLLEVGTGFHPELSGRENIFLNGTILGMKRSEVKAKFDEITEFSGVGKFIDTAIKHYSSGMKVRLAFAVAAHLEPEILIIDEVLAVGDAEFQKKCLGKMEEVAGQGRTVLFVSHNMAAVKSFCTTGIYLDEGKVAFRGEIDACIDKYLGKGSGIEKNKLNVKGRRGNGKVKVVDFSLLDGSDKFVSTFFSGMKLKIKVEFDGLHISPSLIFRLQFISSSGQILFVCNNYHSSASFYPQATSGTATCVIEKLPLNEGIYSINVLCVDNHDVADEIDNAYSFHVEKGDFFGTGKLPNVTQGMLVSHSWELIDGK